jgi:hypothetical protein
MKKTVIFTAIALAMVFGSRLAYAQEQVIPSVVENAPVIAVDPTQVMILELNDLKMKENDPTIGSFTKFIIRLKIRQIENQLNIKKALQ